MPDHSAEAYRTLGLSPNASDAELRVAYRRLVQRHHPDHNGGSAESARQFEAVQDAYAQIRRLRQSAGASAAPRTSGAPGGTGDRRHSSAKADPHVESRLADLERELRAAREARERARRSAREAAVAPEPPPSSGGASSRPSREELGYIETDDSFTKILADAAAEISERLSSPHEHDGHKRISDLIDDLAAKLTGEPPTH